MYIHREYMLFYPTKYLNQIYFSKTQRKYIKYNWLSYKNVKRKRIRKKGWQFKKKKFTRKIHEPKNYLTIN